MAEGMQINGDEDDESRRQRSRVSHDTFTMGPIDKFVRHRRAPWKVITNLTMLFFLCCIALIYVVPIQRSLSMELHGLTEQLLALRAEDDSPPSTYRSKWRGNYALTPTMDLRNVVEVESHVKRVLEYFTTTQTQAETPAALVASGSILTRTFEVRTEQKLLDLDTLRRIAGSDPSLSSSSAEVHSPSILIRFLVAMNLTSLPVTLPLGSFCGDTVPASNLCLVQVTGLNANTTCTPCVPSQWWRLYALSGEPSHEVLRVVRGDALIAQRMLSMTLSTSWTGAASAYHDSEESLSRTWEAMMSWTWTLPYRTNVQSTCVLSFSTKRFGFLSSDDELSPFDGIFTVFSILIVFVLACVDIALRTRALRRIAGDASRATIGRHSSSATRTSVPLTPTALSSPAVASPAAAAVVADGSDADENGDEQNQLMGRTAAHVPIRAIPQTASAHDDEETPTILAPWKTFLLKDKGRVWLQGAIVSDIGCIAFCMLACAERSGVLFTSTLWTCLQISLAVACFGHSVGLVAFLRFTPRAYLLMRATRRAVGRLAYVMLGVFPIYLGFAVWFHFGFGANSAGEFETFGSTCVALIFMMFGDNLLPAFRNIDGSRYWWGRAAADIAGCLYVAVFMGVVLNLAIAVVVDTYKDVCHESKIILLLDSNRGDDDDAGRGNGSSTHEALKRQLRNEIIHNLELLQLLTTPTLPGTVVEEHRRGGCGG